MYHITVYFYDLSNTFLSSIKSAIGNIYNLSVTAPTNAEKFKIWYSDYDTLPSDYHLQSTVYVNNAIEEIKNDLATLFSSNITGIKLNGSTLEVSFNNGTSVGKVSFEGIVEEETILS